jgi:uncharacterized repeat protein (TIGR01451 family)
MSTSPSPATVTLATTAPTLRDSATLSGGSAPTGSLTFTLHASGGATIDTESVVVSGNGTYTTPVGFTLPTNSTAAGTYQWTVMYSGDLNNTRVTDTGEQVVVQPATPALTTSPNPTSGISGSTLKDSATLSGGYVETGSLTFTLHAPGGAILDTETVTVLGNGVYTTPTGFAPSASGTYQWDASYSGDGNNNPVSDNNDPHEQAVVGPTLSTTPNPGAVTLGTSPATLKDSATLSEGNSPTGSLTFTLHAPGGTTVDTEIGVVNGNGTYTTPTGFTLPTGSTVTGTYRWDVSYSGDSKNFSSADDNDPAEQVMVKPASPALRTTPSPTRFTLGAFPATLKDSATLSGAYFATGSLTFTLHAPGGAIIDTETVTVFGSGTYTTPIGFAPSTSGIYQWDASYSGDGNNNPISDDSDPREQATVVPRGADLSITEKASPNPVLSGRRLTYTITVVNHGSEKATGVTVVDPLPARVELNSVATSQGRCTWSGAKKHSAKGGTVTCRLGRLSNGSRATITIIVRVTNPGTLKDTASVTGNQLDPNPANNSASTKTVSRRRAR